MRPDQIESMLHRMQEIADDLESIQSHVRSALDEIEAHNKSVDSEVRSLLTVYRNAHPRARKRA